MPLEPWAAETSLLPDPCAHSTQGAAAAGGGGPFSLAHLHSLLNASPQRQTGDHLSVVGTGVYPGSSPQELQT